MLDSGHSAESSCSRTMARRLAVHISETVVNHRAVQATEAIGRHEFGLAVVP
jgi:hypothetical protein